MNTYASGSKAQITEHFNASEFRCKCGKSHDTPIDTALVDIMERLRSALGCSKIVVSSGYRCPTHNAAVGGSKSSYHSRGMAADICCFDKSGCPIKSAIVACELEDMGVYGIGLNCGGNGVYTHVDSRPKSAKWWGDESKSGYPSIGGSFHDYCGIGKVYTCQYTEPDKSVRYGCRGDAVRWVQWNLNAAGYDCGSVDGIAGAKTCTAIRTYQRDHGLVADGVVGEKTRAALTK